MRLVVDASVAIKWVIDERDSAEALSIQRNQLLAPELMYSECCNILWKHMQRGHLSLEAAIEKVDLLLSSNVTHVPTKILSQRTLEISFQLRHPAYDAQYLAVAEAYRTRVVTADTRLLNRVANTPFAALAISLQDAAAN